MTKKKQTLVSVIVPVYNAEAYLQKCLDSVLTQTYPHLEIILVDDGSTDQSLLVCQKYAQKDSRVQVIHEENGGVVRARKTGLMASTGAFICSIDADDWIEPDYFTQMVQAQESTKADIVACAHFQDIGTISKKIVNRIPAGVYRPDCILPRLIFDGEFFRFGLEPSLWTKLIRREILEKTQLPVDEHIFMGEDMAVVYPSILEANKIAITEICAYHYVQRPGSMVKTIQQDDIERVDRLMNYLMAVFRQKGLLEVIRPQLEQCRKLFLLLRKMEAFEPPILSPYGGLPLDSKIIIYGAGGLGQQIFRYLSNNGYAKILLWVDRNAEYYQEIGMEVYPPEQINLLKGQFDYVLIANIRETVAEEIRKYLLQMHIPADKIRWLSQEFLKS